MTDFQRLITANGYFCNYCDTYHENSEMRHRYVIEVVGEWDGKPVEPTTHEIICPECGREDEHEPFEHMLWSHLRAYHIAKNVPMTFKYPLFDRETDGPTVGHGMTLSVDTLEELADWYCIEVQEVEEVNGEIVVTVEFC